VPLGGGFEFFSRTAKVELVVCRLFFVVVFVELCVAQLSPVGTHEK
jgi:hypothetical protein